MNRNEKRDLAMLLLGGFIGWFATTLMGMIG